MEMLFYRMSEMFNTLSYIQYEISPGKHQTNKDQSMQTTRRFYYKDLSYGTHRIHYFCDMYSNDAENFEYTLQKTISLLFFVSNL